MPYISYCNKCENNKCMLCEQDHDDTHEIIYFGKKLPKINELKLKLNELKKHIDKFKDNINEIINKINNVVNNFDNYYKILFDIIDKYDNKNINFEKLNNINEINNYSNNLINDLNQINSKTNIMDKLKNIFDIYNKIYSNNNKIKIIYKINNDEEDNDEEDNDKNQIKIFGEKFVENNKNNCTIKYEDKEYELMENFELKNINNPKDNIEIILQGINNITNMSYMFSKCSSLISLPDISEWDTSNVTVMSCIFEKC